jgi:DNA-binding response OmpR family regulator
LIVEDDKSIIDAINVAFEFRWPGSTVIAVTFGKDTLPILKKDSPDVILLDINLPDISGFDVLKQIREISSIPVIILTVRSDDEDVLRGLEAGADDYIIKPFNYLTLLARVKTVLRRSEKTPLGKSSHESIISRRLKIDFVNQKVIVDGKKVNLTPVEYRLLLILVKNKDKPVSYEKIADEVWLRETIEDTDNIRIYIRRLRKKLGDAPPIMIINKHGIGYIFKS